MELRINILQKEKQFTQQPSFIVGYQIIRNSRENVR